MAYLKRSDVNSGDEVDLAIVTNETIKKSSGLIVMPVPLLDSDSTTVFDGAGTKREFGVSGIKRGTEAQIVTFINNIDDFLSGQQNVGGDGITEFVSDRLGLKVTMDNVSGTFTVGETVTGGTSTSTGVIQRVESLYLILTSVTGDFIDDEELTGSSSAATSDVNGSTGDGTNSAGNKLNVKVKDWEYSAPPGDPNKIGWTINLVESSTTI